MNQKARFDLARRSKREFDMCAMHRVACLEPDDPTPPEPDELLAQIRWCEPKSPEIVMRRQLQTFYTSSHVPAMSPVQMIVDTGMYFTGGPENSLRFGLAVRLPYIIHT